MTTYKVTFKTMDGNIHRENIQAKSPADAEIRFHRDERLKNRMSRLSYIMSVR